MQSAASVAAIDFRLGRSRPRSIRRRLATLMAVVLVGGAAVNSALIVLGPHEYRAAGEALSDRLRRSGVRYQTVDLDAERHLAVGSLDVIQEVEREYGIPAGSELRLFLGHLSSRSLRMEDRLTYVVDMTGGPVQYDSGKPGGPLNVVEETYFFVDALTGELRISLSTGRSLPVDPNAVLGS